MSSTALPPDGSVDALEDLMKLQDLMDDATTHAVLMYFVSACLPLESYKIADSMSGRRKVRRVSTFCLR
mgnify:CR=1 FL=1